MTLVGKFIKDEWINGDFRSTWLRRITRETKTQYISDSQRYFRNFDDGVDDRVFKPKWSTRYNKLPNGDYNDRGSSLRNPDGYSVQTTIDLSGDISELKCKKSYDELFKVDLRTIQHVESYPVKIVELRYKREDDRGWVIPDNFFELEHYIELQSGDAKGLTGWNAPLIKWLVESFKVPVYRLHEEVREHNKLSDLSRFATYMHINHFGDDKKRITSDENYHNRTIMFWLFDDKLIFQYENGKDSW